VFVDYHHSYYDGSSLQTFPTTTKIPKKLGVRSSSLSSSLPLSSWLPKPEYVCDNNHNKNGTNTTKFVQRHWEYIDSFVLNQQQAEESNKIKVSGGIFLYPRQATILTYLIQKIQYEITNNRPTKRNLTICETGFGSGHSTALFQGAVTVPNSGYPHSTSARIVSFDKFDRQYQFPLWRYLKNESKNGPIHHDYVVGNSCETVPNHLSSTATDTDKIQCDVLHGSSLCPRDNIDLVENSPCGVLLTSTGALREGRYCCCNSNNTFPILFSIFPRLRAFLPFFPILAMNDLKDRSVYFGPRAQWRDLRDRGCITDIVCFQEDQLDSLERDFVFARKGSTYTGKFCIAMTTGKCQNNSNHKTGRDKENECTTAIYKIVSALSLNKICPQHQVKVPS
jgi:hypothetical protein